MVSAMKVWLSDRNAVVDPQDATISVFDRGFLYGDSVYETMRTVGPTHVLAWEEHLDRLQRSADGIGLDLEFSRESIRNAVARTIAAAGFEQSQLRVVVTRGAGAMGIDTRNSADPLLVVFVDQLRIPAAERYQQGISAWMVRGGASHRSRAGLKTGNYLSNILALRRAIEKRGDDAILCTPEGAVTEGATSNVFARWGHRLGTPHLDAGLLPGITRSMTLALARSLAASKLDFEAGPEVEVNGELLVEECEVSAKELGEADEIFLTSSLRGLMPVTHLDGQKVGAGEPGPVTRALLAAYEAQIQHLAQKEPNNIGA